MPSVRSWKWTKPNEAARRAPADAVAEIRELRDDDPEWAGFGENTDRLVGLLLDEGRRHHAPRELGWEYAAGLWSELYGPPADFD